MCFLYSEHGNKIPTNLSGGMDYSCHVSAQVLYALTAGVAGYVSAVQYKTMGGTNWVSAVLSPSDIHTVNISELYHCHLQHRSNCFHKTTESLTAQLPATSLVGCMGKPRKLPLWCLTAGCPRFACLIYSRLTPCLCSSLLGVVNNCGGLGR